MAAKKKQPTPSPGPVEGMTLIVCSCGHETSGPNMESVAATHARHLKKTGHAE